MRTRKEIKAIGRTRFTANYWQCVGAVFLVGLVIAALNGAFTLPTIIRTYIPLLTGESGGDLLNGSITYTYTTSTVSFTPFIGPVLSLIIGGPLSIGLCYFFISVVLNNVEEIQLGTPFRSAFRGYDRKLGGYLWMILFTFLWSLLFFIPGIIKGFSYAMTPYILADCPNVRGKDALTLSKRIMAGHKWQLFVFYLSFLGWEILSLFTMGLLHIFYIKPYMESSLATYYLEVRENALNNGTITMGQLDGTEAV